MDPPVIVGGAGFKSLELHVVDDGGPVYGTGVCLHVRLGASHHGIDSLSPVKGFCCKVNLQGRWPITPVFLSFGLGCGIPRKRLEQEKARQQNFRAGRDREGFSPLVTDLACELGPSLKGSHVGIKFTEYTSTHTRAHTHTHTHTHPHTTHTHTEYTYTNWHVARASHPSRCYHVHNKVERSEAAHRAQYLCQKQKAYQGTNHAGGEYTSHSHNRPTRCFDTQASPTLVPYGAQP
jgi:hypothetical protein